MIVSYIVGYMIVEQPGATTLQSNLVILVPFSIGFGFIGSQGC